MRAIARFFGPARASRVPWADAANHRFAMELIAPRFRIPPACFRVPPGPETLRMATPDSYLRDIGG